ncbi:MAG TPA: hypothetical protein VE821_01520 [Pyrinomonadaceae bacterium]|nr:hypothetical protein [Pyrinomonadaceae bacterium]
MSRYFRHSSTFVPFILCLLFALPLCARAQEQSQIDAKDDPTFHDYKGVHLGMSADEARQKLGTPQDKSDQQDFYAVSDKETVQVSYDAQHNVAAIAIMFLDADKAPAPKAVLGAELTANPDGRIYRLVRYPKVGYWVSYSRTAGDAPLVTVMMQKYKP